MHILTHSLQSGLTFSASKWILMDLNRSFSNHGSTFGNMSIFNQASWFLLTNAVNHKFKTNRHNVKQIKWGRYWIQEESLFLKKTKLCLLPMNMEHCLMSEHFLLLQAIFCHLSNAFWQFYRLLSQRLQYLWSYPLVNNH
jgi:hypothetical protein